MLVHGNNEQNQVINAGQSFFIPLEQLPCSVLHTDVQYLNHTREVKCRKGERNKGLDRLEVCGQEQRRKGLTVKVHEGLLCSQIISLHFGMPKSCAASKMKDKFFGMTKSKRDNTTCL